MYKLHGTYLSVFGFVAGWLSGQNNGSNIALSGFLDLPARTGKTFQSWGDENGVEPYVLASEITFGGRDLTLTGLIHAENRANLLANCDNLKFFMQSFTDLVDFETKWGTYKVQVTSVPVEFIAKGTAKIVINMRDPVVAIGNVILNTTLTPISLKTFGATLLSTKGDRYSMPAIKGQHFTAYETEGYQITKTEAPVLEMELLIKGDNWNDFQGKVKGFGALLAKEGLRTINMPNDKARQFFVTDGMQLTRVIARGVIYGFVSFKGIEIR